MVSVSLAHWSHNGHRWLEPATHFTNGIRAHHPNLPNFCVANTCEIMVRLRHNFAHVSIYDHIRSLDSQLKRKDFSDNIIFVLINCSWNGSVEASHGSFTNRYQNIMGFQTRVWFSGREIETGNGNFANNFVGKSTYFYVNLHGFLLCFVCAS